MGKILLINEKELFDKIKQRIELFNIKDRIEDPDTRRQVLIQVMDAIEECNQLNNTKDRNFFQWF